MCRDPDVDRRFAYLFDPLDDKPPHGAGSAPSPTSASEVDSLPTPRTSVALAAVLVGVGVLAGGVYSTLHQLNEGPAPSDPSAHWQKPRISTRPAPIRTSVVDVPPDPATDPVSTAPPPQPTVNTPMQDSTAPATRPTSPDPPSQHSPIGTGHPPPPQRAPRARPAIDERDGSGLG